MVVWAHRRRKPRTTNNLPNGSPLIWGVTNGAAVKLPDQAFSRATRAIVDSVFDQTTRLLGSVIGRSYFVSYLPMHGPGDPDIQMLFMIRSR